MNIERAGSPNSTSSGEVPEIIPSPKAKFGSRTAYIIPSQITQLSEPKSCSDDVLCLPWATTLLPITAAYTVGGIAEEGLEKQSLLSKRRGKERAKSAPPEIPEKKVKVAVKTSNKATQTTDIIKPQPAFTPALGCKDLNDIDKIPLIISLLNEYHSDNDVVKNHQPDLSELAKQLIRSRNYKSLQTSIETLMQSEHSVYLKSRPTRRTPKFASK